jgi:hypothetical protein
VQCDRAHRAHRQRRQYDERLRPDGGFNFTQQTKDNFGKIQLKRGHRVIEFVLKYYF